MVSSKSPNVKYSDIESQAQMMQIINNGSVNKKRKDSVPLNVKNNKDFTFGMRSDLDPQHSLGSPIAPGVYTSQKGASSMHKIITHSDNIMEGLQKKIAIKMALMDNKHKVPRKSLVPPTKASELRSQSVLTTKTLNDINRSLDQKRINKANRNDQSFSQIEKEK